MKNCSTSLATKEIQNKTTGGNHFIPIKMAKIKKTDYPNADKNVQQLEFSYIHVGSIKWKITLKSYVGVSYIVKHTSVYKLTIPFLDIYSRELKTTVCKKIHIRPYS